MGCSPDKSDPSIAVYHYVPLAFLDLWLSFHSTCGSVSMHTVLFDTSQLALGTPVVQTLLIAWVECQWCGVQQNSRLPMFSKFLLAKVFSKIGFGSLLLFSGLVWVFLFPPALLALMIFKSLLCLPAFHKKGKSWLFLPDDVRLILPCNWWFLG